MSGKYILVTGLVLIMLLAVISCSHDPLINYSVGGSILLTGSVVDENMRIEEPETVFYANEYFYFYFHNNEPFQVEEITVQLANSATEKVLAEDKFPVYPEALDLTDMIWFSSPGRYKIVIIVEEEVRSIREVVIK